MASYTVDRIDPFLLTPETWIVVFRGSQPPGLKQARPAAQYMLVGTAASTVTEPPVEDCTWVPVTTLAMDPEDVVVCCWVAA